MSDISWIKLKIQMFDDEKVKIIESMPDGDSILIIWLKLLVQAGKTNANGYIFLNENVPFTPDMLATIFNRKIATIRMALEWLQKLGMIEVKGDGFIMINNWEKHQNIEGMDKIREQNRIRQAGYRNKQKQLTAKETEDVTLQSRYITEQNKNKNKIKNKNKKESKEINKESSIEGWNEYFDKCWNTWTGYKLEQFRFTYKPTAELTAKKQLVRLADGDPVKAQQIIETSIANGYQGLFELKQKRNNGNINTKTAAQLRDEGYQRTADPTLVLGYVEQEDI